MDRLVWWMVFYNFITPTIPLLFPWRGMSTAAAVHVLPWWVVLLLANGLGGLGMLPVTLWFRQHGPEQRQHMIEHFPLLGTIRHRYRRNMFLAQIMLNATPLPDYASSWLAGSERYPLWRLWLAQLVGRTFHNLPLVLAGWLTVKAPWFMAWYGFVNSPWVSICALVVAITFIGLFFVRQLLDRMISLLLCNEE